ncbi:hypothetical protein PIB30_032794 [Stylosanthes scabra]|uniref:Uncharacterized protein n=1 Tax=Stylosanthes scabra TaxID=79078 RepID=A0ABU6WBZ8_9FABA|nr:hypothetical protein [Stylosanthes scabra]
MVAAETEVACATEQVAHTTLMHFNCCVPNPHLSPVTILERPFDDYTGFNRQSSERKWLKMTRGTRRSQTKPRRSFLDPVCTHPRASAYAPIALGGTARVEIEANAYALEAPVHTHQCSPASINRGSLHHSRRAQTPFRII